MFQEYFKSHNTFLGSAQSSWVGVLSTGVPYLGAPFMTYLCQKERFSQRYYIWVGWFICVVGLVAAAFCKSLIPLALTQGLCYGVGSFILDVPVLLILNTWFLRRRGVAYGILFATTDFFAFALSFLAEVLLKKYGFRTSMLIFAAVMFAVPGAALCLLRERGTDPDPPSTSSPDDLPQPPLPQQNCCTDLWNGNGIIYYKRPMFYILTLSNLMQAFGFYLPFIYLPSYAADLGYSSTKGAMLLAISNLAQIIGELCFGKLSDMINVHGLCVLGSSLVASIAVLVLWGLARTLTQLIFFALVFGSFASGLISLWARIGTFFGEKDAQNIYSVMSFGRGIGNIASGPISAALLGKMGAQGAGSVNRDAYAIGKYHGVVLFAGVCMGVSALLGGVGFFAVALEERAQEKKSKATS